MAIVRTGPGAACRHDQDCPHSIGPAAAGFDGLEAIGRLSALRVPGLDGAGIAVGAGPIERRIETPQERLARWTREAAEARRVLAKAPRNAPTGTHPAYRLERAAERAPAPVEDAPVTTPTAPPAIPCTACLHDHVCKLKDSLGEEPLNAEPRYFAPGLRLIVAGIRIDFEDYLPSRIVVTPLSVVPAIAVPREQAMIAAGKRSTRRHPGKAGEELAKARRAADCLAALDRHNGDRRAAADELGIRGNAFAMIVKYAKRPAAGS